MNCAQKVRQRFDAKRTDSCAVRISPFHLLRNMIKYSYLLTEDGNMDIERIRHEIIALSERNEFSGCILLDDKRHETVLSFCHGDASIEYGIKNTLDTKFNVASVGKPITGVAISKLIEDQIVEPSKVISEYIDLKNCVFNRITVEQLLTHTSGLGDYFQQAYNSPYTRSYEDFKDFADIIKQATLAFTPGEKWAYSNLGYLVLGLLIEKLTGKTYYSYVSQNVFTPADMIDSGFWFYNEPVKNRATGYDYDTERSIWRSRVVTPVLRGTSAGGWFSTVHDLSKFMEALLTCRLLNNSSTDKVITPKPELNAAFYGYGFFISDHKISHGGDGTGICAQLTYYKASGHTLVVLCNRSSGANAVEQIIDRVLL